MWSKKPLIKKKVLLNLLLLFFFYLRLPEGFTEFDAKKQQHTVFDYESIKDDDDKELWLIRVPQEVKQKIQKRKKMYCDSLAGTHRSFTFFFFLVLISSLLGVWQQFKIHENQTVQNSRQTSQ